MSEMSTNRKIINIHGEDCLVSCEQKYKTVWIAVGISNKKFIQQNGSSEEEAFSNWEKEALHMSQ